LYLLVYLNLAVNDILILNKKDSSSKYKITQIRTSELKVTLEIIEGDDEGEGIKWFVVGSALGKIYLYRGNDVLRGERNK
jgi:hypothetical protein